MNIDSNAIARPSPQQEADAALFAITDQSRADNLNRITALSESANKEHIAEYIRGMVEVTMDHLSADAPSIIRANAEQWQDWALGVADGVERGVPAQV